MKLLGTGDEKDFFLIIHHPGSYVHSAICLSAFKMGYHYDTLRKESALTDNYLVTWSASHLVPVLGILFVGDLNFAL